MKLNKKLVCFTAAAAMSIASVSAFAANGPTSGLENVPGAPVQGTPSGTDTISWTNVPVLPFPVNYEVGMSNVYTLMNQGFWFEAHRELDRVTPTNAVEVATVADVRRIIEDGIDRVIINEAFADVESFMDDGYYAEARNVLINDVFPLSMGTFTASPLTGATTGASEILYRATSFTLDDWNRAKSLEAKIAGVIGDVVASTDDAIAYVKNNYDVPANVSFYAVKVGNRFDVYASTTLPSGRVAELGELDIANTGFVLSDSLPFARKAVYNNPIAQ